MKTLVGLLIAVFSLSAETAFAQTQPSEPFGLSGLRIAFFSPQRAFSDSDDGKAGLARLKALDEKRGREVEARTTELRKREEALKASLGMLSADGRVQQTREIEKFRLDVDRFIQDAQAEFLAVRREIEDAFLVAREADPRAGGEGSEAGRDPERRCRDASPGRSVNRYHGRGRQTACRGCSSQARVQLARPALTSWR